MADQQLSLTVSLSNALLGLRHPQAVPCQRLVTRLVERRCGAYSMYSLLVSNSPHATCSYSTKRCRERPSHSSGASVLAQSHRQIAHSLSSQGKYPEAVAILKQVARWIEVIYGAPKGVAIVKAQIGTYTAIQGAA